MDSSSLAIANIFIFPLHSSHKTNPCSESFRCFITLAQCFSNILAVVVPTSSNNPGQKTTTDQLSCVCRWVSSAFINILLNIDKHINYIVSIFNYFLSNLAKNKLNKADLIKTRESVVWLHSLF